MHTHPQVNPVRELSSFSNGVNIYSNLLRGPRDFNYKKRFPQKIHYKAGTFSVV